jgi:hypothetical protein
MANPFAAQSSGMESMMPLMAMLSMSQNAPKPAAPASAPAMSPGTFKTPNASGSFAGSPVAPPTQNQVGGKTLLGQ